MLTWRYLIFLLMIVSVTIIIFFENRDPARTTIWLLLMVFLPEFGLILYLLFGENLRKGRLRKILLKLSRFLNREDLRSFISLQKLSMEQRGALKDEILFPGHENENIRKIAGILLYADRSPIFVNNQVKIYAEGTEKFKDLFKDLESAQSSIHLEYFIFKYSSIGCELQQLLIKKARQGVKVRFIYDQFGSFRLLFRPSFTRAMREAGIDLHPALKVSFPYVHRTFNYRNHRKIAVIDGRVGYLGGLNIGDEYIHRSPRFGFWRDTHLRIEGEAVYALQFVFLADYYLNARADFEINETLFPPMSVQGDTVLQICSSGPDTNHENIYNAYFTAITQATRRICIQTPYFIPDEGLLTALRTALLAGVEVHILFPSFADHPVVYHASLSYLSDLMKLGATVHLYKKGFLHSKLLIVDDQVASCGSTNVDIRSFQLNFEVNTFIYDKKTVKDLLDLFNADLLDSEVLNYETFSQRSIVRRFFESAARILSPVL